MVKHAMEQEARCSFKPKINKKSERMMAGKIRYTVDTGLDPLVDSMNQTEKPEPLHERLYGLSMAPKFEARAEPEHKPKINHNSATIVGLMKDGDDYDREKRWISLYQYGTEKIQMKNALAKEVKKMKENEEIE
jgi:hypothetical protein